MPPEQRRKQTSKTKSKSQRKPDRNQARKNNPDSPGKYSQDVREEMFIHFCRSRSIAATAKKFKCSPVTLQKIKKQDNWVDRFDRVLDKVREKSEDKAAKKISARVTTAKQILNCLGAAFVKKDGKDVDVEPDARAWVKVAEYIDDQEAACQCRRRRKS